MCVRLCGCSLNIVIKWEYTFSKGRALLKKMAASRNKIAEPPSICQRAENETRTRDPNLGKVVLYQLSYFRIAYHCLTALWRFSECKDTHFCNTGQIIRPFFYAQIAILPYLPRLRGIGEAVFSTFACCVQRQRRPHWQNPPTAR